MTSQSFEEVLQTLRNEDEESWLRSLQGSNSKFTHDEIVRPNDTRVDLKYYRDLIYGSTYSSDSEKAIIVTEILSTAFESGQEFTRVILALYKECGKACILTQRYDEAVSQYKTALGVFMRDETHSGIFSREFYNPYYMEAFQKQPGNNRIAIFLDSLICCCEIATAYTKLNDCPSLEVMEWLQEVQVFYECFKYNTTGIHSRLLRIPYPDIALYRMVASRLYVQQFLQLRNLAAACYYVWRIKQCYGNWFSDDVPEFTELDRTTEPHKALKIASYRHPHFTLSDQWSIEFPELQLRGNWSKVRALLGVRPPNLPNPNAWIWNSRLYVRWGESEFNKLWYLDLKNPIWWNHSTPFSERYFGIQPSLGKPLVYKDIVWFFSGNLNILRFNLVSETWNSVRTYYRGVWPFGNDGIAINNFSIYNVERYKDKMCIFGASSNNDSLFMTLNMRTHSWRNFDITPKPFNCELTENTPLGRCSGNIWVVEEEDRLYVMYGNILLEKANRHFNAELYADLWSFSFKTELWTRERLRGNFPSPRMAMAYAYHNRTKKLVAFGGMADFIPFLLVKDGKPKSVHPYYADTFVMDTDTLLWKQVVTRSFPAWRACARMLIDDTDGKIYIYGGYSSNIIAFGIDNGENRSFGDIWCLDLDTPGYSDHFDERAFEEFSPLKAGAFRRCFQCKKSGRNYLRCQGACGRKAIYCSKDCQRLDWKAHKTAYGCRKL